MTGKHYAEDLGKDIQESCLDSYSEYGQSKFDRYILFSDNWLQDNEFRDPDTGSMYTRENLDAWLSEIEKPAGISNPKDFRQEVVNFALRYRAKHGGNNPSWTSYEKLREVIEKTMFDKIEDMLPVVSFSGHRSKEDKKKHDSFMKRMKEKGYTEKQVRIVWEWYDHYRHRN